MAYQALYRVWRPQRFDDMIGQEVITRTLKNAITTNQISHAYLFAGPRGTGKTSAAKIFAKAINCHHQQDGEPCNECETCKAITAGTLNDVIEIDAASNNGVEEIRDIRDKVKYAPTVADYKVYIIDEVHMLSTGAFNALLKTLEEPPANVIFILATTEPHKIPATIISRVQRFDFKRIAASDSYHRMTYILDQKHVTYDEQAIKVIAKAAEGGMRDALSILDQALSFGDNEITLDNALLVTGSVTHELLATYVQQVLAGDTKAGLATLQSVLEAGKDAERFTEDIISYARDLLLYQQAPKLVEEAEMGSVSEDFQALADKTPATTMYAMINELNAIQQQMRFTTHPDVYLEILTIKLAEIGRTQGASAVASPPAAPAGGPVQTPATADTVTALQHQVDQLKVAVQQLEQAPVAKPAARPAAKPRVNATHTQEVNLAKINPVLGAATREKLNQLQQVWPDLLNSLTVTQRAVMKVSQPVAAADSGVIVAFDYSFLYQKATTDQELTDALENGLDRMVGTALPIVFVPKDQWPEIRKNYLTAHKSELKPHTEPQPVADGTGPSSTAPTTDAGAPVAAPNETGPQPPQANPVVTKAEELFGKNIVDIKTD
ncbi:DNA polymerase III subunit gamma/tau [Levilactobacillus acidifarinae]|uniref:DNA-directed DNA polymerase n=1 Tax=Levilactobacillus acidifarinae DSM 19394 = JCM 15949 TaxID=1423715 RepID=A0A0R1LLL6_9LACO|nr:DNA polymerase III subunit gamma/tau [Levilactobacillus acidifarinae]KRK96456.1 DNA polymerase III, gamma tau subunit [Levilactobacillus acidifarinae DSM 19394]GEO68958.1 DNA polymerase III subunit gamma/tau [Levilactobacillus acidifarinae]